MPEAPATLEYGHVPRRRRLRNSILIGLLLIALALSWHYGGPARNWIAQKYQHWRYVRQFDAVQRELSGTGRLWLAPSGQSSRKQRADELLLGLMDYSPGLANFRNGAPNLVLFVCAHATAKGPRLSFACVGSIGLTVYDFDRADAGTATYFYSGETREFWVHSDQWEAEVVSLDSKATIGSATVSINRANNKIGWTLTDPAAVVTSFKPTTGWIGNENWWPDNGSFRMIEGSAKDRVVPMRKGARSIAFLDDDHIAAADREAVDVIPIAAPSQTVSHPLPTANRLSFEINTLAFSPDGRWLFEAGIGSPAWLIDVRSGTSRVVRERGGWSTPNYLDNQTLLMLDSEGLYRVDCPSLKIEEIPKPADYFSDISARGSLMAYMTGLNGRVRVVDSAGTVKGNFAPPQGLRRISISPDQRWLVMKGQDGMCIIDLESGRREWGIDVSSDFRNLSPIKWTADGSMGATACNEFAYVWCTNEPRWIARFPHGRGGNSPDVALSPDGKGLAVSADAEQGIAYWPDLRAALQFKR